MLGVLIPVKCGFSITTEPPESCLHTILGQLQDTPWCDLSPQPWPSVTSQCGVEQCPVPGLWLPGWTASSCPPALPQRGDGARQSLCPQGRWGSPKTRPEAGQERKKEKKDVLHLMKSQPAVWLMKMTKTKHEAVYLLHICIFCRQWLLFCAQLRTTTHPHVRRHMVLCFNTFHCGC